MQKNLVAYHGEHLEAFGSDIIALYDLRPL